MYPEYRRGCDVTENWVGGELFMHVYKYLYCEEPLALHIYLEKYISE